MIAVFVAYAVAVGLTLAASGVMLERQAALRSRPKRWVWAGMIGVSLVLIGWLPWRSSAAASPAPVALFDSGATAMVRPGPPTPWNGQLPSRWAAGRDRLRGAADDAAAALSWLDVSAGWVWASASGALALAYGLGRWMLSRRRRAWRTARVQGVSVLVSPRDGPAVVGVLAPSIVLPEWALDLGTDAVGLMVCHEREHVAAHDPLLIHLAGLVLLVMPWNPAAWWMVSRLRLAVELDCDARVLRAGRRDVGGASATPAAYAELLLAVAARRSSRVAVITPALLEHASMLRRRIAAMYPSHIRLRGLRAICASGAALVLLGITLGLPAPRLMAHAWSAPVVLPVTLAPSPTHEVAMTAAAAPVTMAAAHAPGPAAVPRARPVGPARQTTGPKPDERGEAAQADAPYQIGNGIVSPVLIFKTNPNYTSAAMAARIQGEVWLEGVVEKDGTLSTLSIRKSLDPTLGLDQSALDAASKWRFKPGTKDGLPVRVLVQLILEFRLSPTVYTVGTPGLVAPVVTLHPDPVYTPDAMRAKIQGTVKIEAVVGTDGTVGSARIVESLDQTFGLDESALTAARQWTFEPGTLRGTAVPVRVVLSLEFRLH